MEKLGLEKFQDAKLENKQLSFVHAGDTCTGGGGRILFRVNLPANRGHYYMCESYESDSIDEYGNTTLFGSYIHESELYIH